MTSSDITCLLVDWSNGDKTALNKLMPIVYNQLHHLAQRHLSHSRPDPLTQTTILVHEVFLRLVEQTAVSFKDRSHFFAVASKAMRQILVNYAIAQQTAKRGGNVCKVSINEATIATQEKDLDILALDEALKELAEMDQRKSEIVELRFFSGLSLEETAENLGISLATVKREWVLARAWLLHHLNKGGGREA